MLTTVRMAGNGRAHRIAADITDSSFQGWRAFADGCAVSLAAFLEVLGPELERWGRTGKPPDLDKLVSRTKKLDTERRRRGAS